MTETMQRWTMSALGRESLTLIQEPIPQPGPGEVRVRVNAVALNYRDKMVNVRDAGAIGLNGGRHTRRVNGVAGETFPIWSGAGLSMCSQPICC